MPIMILAHGGRNYAVLYDEEDAARIEAEKWRLVPSGYTFNAVRDYKRQDGSWRNQAMHRFILGVTERLEYVDHINFNGLDNRRVNLRVLTPQQSACHRRKTCLNTTGYKGVTIVKGRYIRAQIKSQGKNYHLGHFPTIEEAVLARDQASLKYHGEFAQLNFPPPPAVPESQPAGRGPARKSGAEEEAREEA